MTDTTRATRHNTAAKSDPHAEYHWDKTVTSYDDTGVVIIPLVHNHERAGVLTLPQAEAESLVRMLRWRLEATDD